jgi:lysophospholipase L1-like esterase
VARLGVNLALGLASLALVVGLAEIATRVLVGPVRPRNLTIVPRSIRAPAPIPGLPYLLRPNAEVVHAFGSNPRGYLDEGGMLTYRTNALGWRSSPLQREKRPGRFRLLGLGDSVTFGTGVREQHLFLSRLRDALETEAPGRYEVWNLGVMGYNTTHEVALLRHAGLDLDPDLVVLFYVLNDAETQLPKEVRRSLGLEAERPGGGAAARRSPSLLLDHLRARVESRELRRRTIRLTRAWYLDGSPGWVQVQGALREAAGLAERRGFGLALVIFPFFWELDADYPFAGAHDRVAGEAKRLGIPVLDLLDDFRGRDAEALWVHPSNQHPNEEAHAIAAEALLRFLREERLLGSG